MREFDNFVAVFTSWERLGSLSAQPVQCETRAAALRTICGRSGASPYRGVFTA